jgi:o-succinylbenzoate synthase
MKIDKLEIIHIKLPLRHFFETSFGKFTHRHLIILKGYSNQTIVYGEAPALIGPFYTSETIETVMHILKDFIGPKVVGKDFKSIEDVHKAMGFVRGNNIAKSGIDTLFYNLMSIEKGVSLSKLIGGTIQNIESGVSIGIQESIPKLLDRIQMFLDIGYKRIKIKIKPGWDINVLEAIRKKFPEIKLMVDANSAYTLDDINTIKKFDKYNLLMIEQPLDDDDIIDHAKIQKQIKTPICLDESICSLDDARKAIELNSCKIINIKLARVGGLLPAIKIHNFCREKNIPVWCGGMLESGIGEAFAIALASLPGFTLAGDVAPSDRYLKEDIIKPLIEIKDGLIAVPDKPGLGFIVDENKLKKYTVERILIK